MSYTPESFIFEGILFESVIYSDGLRLQTKQHETANIEYKGFGKLMHWEDKRKLYQPKELEEQITAFMNTGDGMILLGIEDGNHVLKGGNYTNKEKDKLTLWLKNLAKKYNISGMGLIEDPLFIEFPKKYWIPSPIAEDETRYLVIIKIKKSPELIKVDGKVLIRELGGVTEITEDRWRAKNSPNSIKKTLVNLSINSSMNNSLLTNSHMPSKLPATYAQILKSR